MDWPAPRRIGCETGGSSSTTASDNGMNNSTVVPWPTLDWMAMWPPDCCMKPYTIDMPSPVPLPMGLVVKKGSNARSTTSGAMPAPVSATATIA
ncbi:hypothetical protein D3C81_1724160 [compost metagenome]